MRVIVCGDREWKDRKAIHRELSRLPPGTVIVEGGARGADSIAAGVAYDLGLPVESHPAKWDEYGPRAGPIRNQEMLDSGADLVLAFHSDLSKSKGTAHMLKIARAAGVKCLHLTC